MSINVNDVLEGIKSDVMGWINDGIASANINGITVTTNSVITATLPPYIAYTNLAQAFTEQQTINATTTDATGQSIAALNVVGWADPSADDSGIKAGIFITSATVSGNANDVASLWGSTSYGVHYGTGTIGRLAGVVATSENYNAGVVTVGVAVSAQVHNRGAGSFTDGTAFSAEVPNVVAGSITNTFGLFVNNQGASGVTTAKGIHISAQSGATTNYAIYSAGGDVYLIDTSAATSGSPVALYANYTVTPGSASSATFDAMQGITISSGANNITGDTRGVTGVARADGSGTITTLNGIYGIANNNSTGTVTNAYAVRGRIGMANASQTTTNAYGVIAQAVFGSLGTLTSIAQIAIVPPGYGTNRTNLLVGTATIPSGTWNIYSTSTEPSYFAGRLVMAEISTPSNPAANQLAVYAKDDGGGTTKLYTLDSAGTETALGSGGSGAPTDATYVTLSTNGTLTNERVLTAGANITLTDAGAGSTITVAANTKYIAFLSPLSNEPPSASYATLDTRNGHPCLDFSGTADEEAVFSLVLPAWYAGGGLTVDTYWAFTSATSGNLRVQAGIERIDESSLDIDADSFAAFQSAGGTAPGTSGQVIKVSVAFTAGGQMDSWAASEMGRLKIRRDADGTSGTDDITTDAELLGVVIRET